MSPGRKRKTQLSRAVVRGGSKAKPRESALIHEREGWGIGPDGEGLAAAFEDLAAQDDPLQAFMAEAEARAAEVLRAADLPDSDRAVAVIDGEWRELAELEPLKKSPDEDLAHVLLREFPGVSVGVSSLLPLCKGRETTAEYYAARTMHYAAQMRADIAAGNAHAAATNAARAVDADWRLIFRLHFDFPTAAYRGEQRKRAEGGQKAAGLSKWADMPERVRKAHRANQAAGMSDRENREVLRKRWPDVPPRTLRRWLE